MNFDYRRSLDSARHFRMLGLVPLPSRMDKKSPLLHEYGKYRTTKVPQLIYSEDSWKTTNLQLLTGTNTPGSIKIVVVDLDGDMAIAAWKKLCKIREYRVTSPWIARTGSGGMHLYFQVRHDLTECPSRLLWALYDPLGGKDNTGGWKGHTEVRLLADGALVVAPPSRHVRTGMEYGWWGKYHPGVFPLPEFAPEWLLQSSGIALPKPTQPASYVHAKASKSDRGFGLTHERQLVLEAISPSEKLALAHSWGLRTVGRPLTSGWVTCRSIDREDAIPSAGFDPRTGVYREPGNQLSISFFDLAVRLGVYPDWRTSYEALRRCALIGSRSLS